MSMHRMKLSSFFRHIKRQEENLTPKVDPENEVAPYENEDVQGFESNKLPVLSPSKKRKLRKKRQKENKEDTVTHAKSDIDVTSPQKEKSAMGDATKEEFKESLTQGLKILDSEGFSFNKLDCDTQMLAFQFVRVLIEKCQDTIMDKKTTKGAPIVDVDIAKDTKRSKIEEKQISVKKCVDIDDEETFNNLEGSGKFESHELAESMMLDQDYQELQNVITGTADIGESNILDNRETIPSLIYNFDSATKYMCAKQEYTQMNQFLKQVQFSPDGTRLLSNCEDNTLRLYSLDDSSQDFNDIKSQLSFRPGDCVYDYKWYPYSNSYYPGSSVFITTSKDQPIKMWDAEHGNIRATYLPQTQHNELIHALSVTFNLDGTKIYAGFKDFIRVFDVQNPGSTFEEYPLVILNDPDRRKKLRPVRYNSQMPGFVSCLSFSPDNSGIFACGSYESTVGIYSEDNVELIMKFQTGGGVTDIKFSKSGQYVYAGSRKDEWVYCWDIRNPSEEVYRYKRSCPTSQHLYFDIDPTDNYLALGTVDHKVLIYHVNDPSNPHHIIEGPGDVVNSVQFHPSLPVLACSTGTRRFVVDDISDSSSSESDFENEIILWRL